MTWLLSKITGNPMVLLWLGLAAVAAGAGVAGTAAWKVQGYRLDALQGKYDVFVAKTKAEGEKAQIARDAQIADDKTRKETSDAAHKTALDRLRADNKRLRDASASRSFVPAPAPTARSPERACFKRAELERAIQFIDAEISGLVGEGDANGVGLDIAKFWAARR